MCPKIRWRDLKAKRATMFKDKVIEEGERNFKGESIAIWNQMADYIRKVAKEVLGELKGKIYYDKLKKPGGGA